MIATLGWAGLLGVFPFLLGAQNDCGGGITTFNGDSTSVSFLRGVYPEHAVERLKAIVVFRGALHWTWSALSADSLRKARTDSVLAAMRERGARIGGGLITEHAVAWVEYDCALETLRVSNTIYRLPNADSVLVVLGDSTDTNHRVQDAFAIHAARADVPASPTIYLGPDLPDQWWELVRVTPRLRAFVEPAIIR